MNDEIEIAQSYMYCPRCGVPRATHQPSRPFRCGSCGHTSFFGPVAAVGGVIVNSANEILLIERARDPGKGKLGMPGGFVDAYENAEHSLRREVREEVGVEIEAIEFLTTLPNRYVYRGIVNPVLDIYYSARLCSDQEIRPESSEVTTWMWSSLNDEVLDRMAFDANRKALEYFRNLQV